MRKPTAKELLSLLFLWAVTLIGFGFLEQKLHLLIWLTIDVVETYRHFNVKAYAKLKAQQDKTNARLKQKFGRWSLLAQWSPILFFFAFALPGLLFRDWALVLLLIGFAGLLIGIVLVQVAISGPDSE